MRRRRSEHIDARPGSRRVLEWGMPREHQALPQQARPADETVVDGSEVGASQTTFTGQGPVPQVASGPPGVGSQSASDRAFGESLAGGPGQGAPTPEQQRSYSVEQYEAMWEKSQGKQLSTNDKKQIGEGGVNITANNIEGGGTANPDPFPFPLDRAELLFSTFEAAHNYMVHKNQQLEQWRADPRYAAIAKQGEYIMFAKQYLSQPSDETDERFVPDKNTGAVQNINERYWARPDASDFEYGFWDEGSQSFWHANHMPDVTVYQSSKEYFTARHAPNDRCVFGVALATHYDPGKAALDATSSGDGVAAATK